LVCPRSKAKGKRKLAMNLFFGGRPTRFSAHHALLFVQLGLASLIFFCLKGQKKNQKKLDKTRETFFFVPKEPEKNRKKPYSSSVQSHRWHK